MARIALAYPKPSKQEQDRSSMADKDDADGRADVENGTSYADGGR